MSRLEQGEATVEEYLFYAQVCHQKHCPQIPMTDENLALALLCERVEYHKTMNAVQSAIARAFSNE